MLCSVQMQGATGMLVFDVNNSAIAIYLILNVDFISVIMHRTCTELCSLFNVFYGYRS